MARGPANLAASRWRPAPVLPGALCASEDPEGWFAEIPVLAIKVCLRCPELLACRQWAMEEPGLTGVWGGTTESERRVLRMGGA